MMDSGPSATPKQLSLLGDSQSKKAEVACTIEDTNIHERADNLVVLSTAPGNLFICQGFLIFTIEPKAVLEFKKAYNLSVSTMVLQTMHLGGSLQQGHGLFRILWMCLPNRLILKMLSAY